MCKYLVQLAARENMKQTQSRVESRFSPLLQVTFFALLPPIKPALTSITAISCRRFNILWYFTSQPKQSSSRNRQPINMSGTTLNTPNLTPRDVEIICAMFQSLKSKPDVGIAKLHIIMPSLTTSLTLRSTWIASPPWVASPRLAPPPSSAERSRKS